MHMLKSRNSKARSTGVHNRKSNNVTESDGIFSGNGNYGISTISVEKPVENQKNRSTKPGQEVKSTKPYCCILI